MSDFEILLTQLKTYLPDHDIQQIVAAYEIALHAHKDQLRINGNKYITHPLAVAEILINLKLDYKTIMAAILHDVLEDTSISKTDLKQLFGTKVLELVDGVSKLNKIEFANKIEAQAVNFRKIILAMAKDVRVILIKLADRLHNMRTLDVLPSEKQQRIAKETLEIYAPIALKLGLNVFKIEFEELSFYYLYPTSYQALQARVNNPSIFIKKAIMIKTNIEKKLKTAHINVYECIICNKHLYDIYKKIRKKMFSIDNLSNTITLKIIVYTLNECYQALGIIHKLYKPVHEKFKDYIAIPKSNHYQALHTTIIIPHGPHLEVQICTQQMHQVAEYGVAFALSQNNTSEKIVDMNSKTWLNNLLDLQHKSNNSIEFLENVKTDLHNEEIYVFTTKGDIISLPINSSVVDFAYAVHTELGNSCVAAKINHKLMPLSSKLISGQSIEIIVAPGAHPNPLWLNFVITIKARSSIRNWLKTQQATESCLLGKNLLIKDLKNLSSTLENIDEFHQETLLHELKLPSMNALFTEVGLGNQLSPIIARKLITPCPNPDNLNTPLIINGSEGMIISYSNCCHPIPGDKIIGILNSGRGINVHRADCEKIINLTLYEQEHHIFLEWSKELNTTFTSEIYLATLNEPGVLGAIGYAISNNNANICKIKMNDSDPNHSVLNLVITTNNTEHLSQIIDALSLIPQITSVVRV